MHPFAKIYQLRGWWEVPRLLANLRHAVIPPSHSEKPPLIMSGEANPYRETLPDGSWRHGLNYTVLFLCRDEEHAVEVSLRISGVGP